MLGATVLASAAFELNNAGLVYGFLAVVGHGRPNVHVAPVHFHVGGDTNAALPVGERPKPIVSILDKESFFNFHFQR